MSAERANKLIFCMVQSGFLFGTEPVTFVNIYQLHPKGGLRRKTQEGPFALFFSLLLFFLYLIYSSTAGLCCWTTYPAAYVKYKYFYFVVLYFLRGQIFFTLKEFHCNYSHRNQIWWAEKNLSVILAKPHCYEILGKFYFIIWLFTKGLICFSSPFWGVG